MWHLFWRLLWWPKWSLWTSATMSVLWMQLKYRPEWNWKLQHHHRRVLEMHSQYWRIKMQPVLTRLLYYWNAFYFSVTFIFLFEFQYAAESSFCRADLNSSFLPFMRFSIFLFSTSTFYFWSIFLFLIIVQLKETLRTQKSVPLFFYKIVQKYFQWQEPKSQVSKYRFNVVTNSGGNSKMDIFVNFTINI